ncbi:carboxypeptidase N subunit 2-like [Chironomus tepperi]|uniref:carboxypeptidase N subunit 2-like n=1 Tax=Chironomus tepperi TaxID=113505 RepID=UPI00391FA797
MFVIKIAVGLSIFVQFFVKGIKKQEEDMKALFPLVFISTLALIFQLGTAVEFTCHYGYRLDHGYPCQITKGLISSENDLPASFVGTHQNGKSDNDLKLISFSGNRHLRLDYFPRGTFETFPQLIDFSLQNCQLSNLRNGDFKGAENLKNLNLDLNKLKQLNATTFTGADKLNWLSMSGNEIEKIDKDAFSGLSKLQMLILSQNKLHQLPQSVFFKLVDLQEILLNSNSFETLSTGLFERNTKMKRIWLQNNRLNVIEPQLFEGLTNLALVNLKDNACIDEEYRQRYRETENLQADLLAKCAPGKSSVV